ncbi:MAG: hypothetical protein AAF570_18950 [Bacteroidota bacterium]
MPPGKAKPVLIKDTLGPILHATVSMAAPGTSVRSAGLNTTTRGGSQQVAYQTRGSMTVDDDPAKYLTELKANPNTPMALRMNLGYGSAWLDLTDLDVRGVDIVSGAADVFLSYKKPALYPMYRLKINSGMSNITIRNLEYAKADLVKIENGMGDTRIVIGEQVSHKSKVSISVGAGSCVLLIHEEAPIRLKFNDNVFSSMELPGIFTESGSNTYVNPAVKKHPDKAVTVVVDMGIGTFTVETYKEDRIEKDDD